MTKYKIGQLVKFENQVHRVLGFAASEDENGNKLVELAWNDYGLSPTGYLAVEQDELEPVSMGTLVSYPNVSCPLCVSKK